MRDIREIELQELCNAKAAAGSLFGMLSASWWGSEDPGLNARVEDDLREIANIHGFDLTPRHCPLTETISHAEAAQ